MEMGAGVQAPSCRRGCPLLNNGESGTLMGARPPGRASQSRLKITPPRSAAWAAGRDRAPRPDRGPRKWLQPGGDPSAACRHPPPRPCCVGEGEGRPGGSRAGRKKRESHSPRPADGRPEDPCLLRGHIRGGRAREACLQPEWQGCGCPCCAERALPRDAGAGEGTSVVPGAGDGQPGRMRRFQALRRSFPFLTRFRLYRVSADPRPGRPYTGCHPALSPLPVGKGPAVPGHPRAHTKGQRLLSPRMPPVCPRVPPCPAACRTRRIFSPMPRAVIVVTHRESRLQGMKTARTRGRGEDGVGCAAVGPG